MKILIRIKEALGRRIYKFIASRLHIRNIVITRSLVNLGRKRLLRTMFPNLYSDYIRLATLELCAEELRRKSVAGSIAEVGVYKGDFAAHINRAFHDRKLYIFDTFEGFVEEEIAADIREGLAKPKDFSSDVKMVMDRMPFADNVVPVIGNFNRRALDAVPSNEHFAFVSLDVDLYTPTIEGLRAFYPRLSRGGYIFIHDYNNDHWKGIRKAVEEFTQESDACMVPIPDAQGTIVICK